MTGGPVASRVSRSLEEVGEDLWQTLMPPHPEGFGFFQTIEETLASQFHFYYITITEGSRPVCLAPCFVTDYALETTVEGPLKRAMCWLRRIAPRVLTPRVLVCGSPTGEGWVGLVGSSPSSQPAIAQALVRAMQTIAAEERASLIAFKDFRPAHEDFFEASRQLGFHQMPNYPAAELEISFASFESYLASLSKATRKDLRRKFSKVDGHVQITCEVRRELGELLESAYALYLNTFERSRVKFERLTKEFFAVISKRSPGETTYFLWRIEGRLVAFDLCLVSGTTLVDEYLGMDYDVAYPYHLYYVTFRDIMRWCMAHGIRRYCGGAVNYDPKKRLDFTLVPQTIYLQHQHPLMHRLFGPISRLLAPANFDPLLQPSAPR